MSQLSVAIVGAGNIAGGYDEKAFDPNAGVFTHAGAYRMHGGFALKTVFDMNRTRAEEFARFWKVEKTSETLQEVLSDYHDILSICVPDAFHFSTARAAFEARCCKTIFIEKPVAGSQEEIRVLMHDAAAAGIQLVVNFQRHFDPSHLEIRRTLQEGARVLSASARYMKGLHHIGVTLIDTLVFLLGLPSHVQAFNRVWNEEVKAYSYEFILFYDSLTVAVLTTDIPSVRYNYHVFEIDLLLDSGRISIVDNSQRVRHVPIGDFAYGGVRVLNEEKAQTLRTGYNFALSSAANYIHAVTTGSIQHSENTLEETLVNQYILDRLVESYDSGAVKLNLRSK